MEDDYLEQEEEREIGSIGEKYIIYEKIGSGGRSKVFKVKPKGKNIDKYYAAKVYKKFKKTKINDYEIEKKILLNLKNKSPYILNLIDSGEGEIKRENKKPSTNNYIIVDYMKNGCLFDYILYPGTGLDEDLCKILFYKIFKAIKECHDSNICICDIKLENILLDDNYNPILCDFGFGKITKDQITGKIGTPNYMAPEVFLNKEPYNGFKVDIFNLAIALYILMTRKPFITIENEKIGKKLFAEAYDNRVKLLFDKEYDQFWDKLGYIKYNFSEKLKTLFEKMTLKDPSERKITINDVLKDDWFKDLNNEKIEELERKLKGELDKRNDIVKIGLKTKKEEEEGQSSSSLSENKGSDEKCKQIFSRDLEIKFIDKDSIRENYVFIKCNKQFDPYYFMDKLYNEIDKNYHCKEEEQENRKNLKFNAILPKEITINNGKDKNNIFEQVLNIEIKMYEALDGYLIRFRKKCGELYDYYENVKKIISAIDGL